MGISQLSPKQQRTLEMSASRVKAEFLVSTQKILDRYMNQASGDLPGLTEHELYSLMLLNLINYVDRSTPQPGATNWRNGSMPKRRGINCGINYSLGCGSGSIRDRSSPQPRGQFQLG
jgi:hypothetical protein